MKHPRPPHPSQAEVEKLQDKMHELKYRDGIPVQVIQPDWPVQYIRALLNVTNADPTGRLSAQIKQAMIQGVL